MASEDVLYFVEVFADGVWVRMNFAGHEQVARDMAREQVRLGRETKVQPYILMPITEYDAFTRCETPLGEHDVENY